ncbi:MAG: hypothetical protein IIZ92_25205, partial [Aquincola sp.]|nr:hypothetical protein [Aquincola sp.]
EQLLDGNLHALGRGLCLGEGVEALNPSAALRRPGGDRRQRSDICRQCAAAERRQAAERVCRRRFDERRIRLGADPCKAGTERRLSTHSGPSSNQ